MNKDPEPTPHILETISDKLKDQGITSLEERDNMIQAASVLAYVDATYNVIRKKVSATPLFSFSYDTQNNNIAFKTLKGYARPPKKGTFDVESLDIITAFDLRSIALLNVGDTGVGKTYTAENYLKVILEPQNYDIVRLSGNPMHNNLLGRFVQSKIDGGNFVTEIQEEELDKIAVMVIDELSRARSQTALQLIDGKIDVAGNKKAYLGPRIPKLTENGVIRTSLKKKIQVISCANPPASQDAKFTETVETDAAVGNRVIQVDYPNSAASIGASLWTQGRPTINHDMFINHYATMLGKYLNIDISEVKQDLSRDWLDMYAYTLDPARTEKQMYYSALEFADVLLQVLGGDIKGKNAQEVDICNDWLDTLAGTYNITFKNDLEVDDTDNDLQLLEKAVKFDTTVVNRDISQLNDLADITATIKRLKTVFRSSKPLETYLKQNDTLQIDDVASASGILASNKEQRQGSSSIDAINTALKEYTSLVTDYKTKVFGQQKAFDLKDPNDGLKVLAIKKSLHDLPWEAPKATYLVKGIYEQIEKLYSLSNTSQVRHLILSRTIADLSTLAGFVDMYSKSIDNRLARIAQDEGDHTAKAWDMLGEFYSHKLGETGSYAFEDIFEHRIPRTLGRR